MTKIETEKLTKQEILRQGAKGEFWKLIVVALEESKRYLQKLQDDEGMKDLPAEQYKLMNELIKAKKDYLDMLIKTPENIISWLETPDEDKRDFDPYEKP